MAKTADDLNEGSQVTLEQIRARKARADLLDHVNNMVKSCRQQRMQFERQWYMNLAFYFGKHYVQWNSEALGALGVTENAFTRLYEPKAPPWRVRMITNKIRPIIRGELAKVTKERPRGFVIPASSDDDDLAAARAGDSLIEFLWREKSLQKVIRRAEFWALICGTSFMKDWFDPKKKDSSGIKGDIQVEPVSPFHILVPDIQEEEIENQPYVIHILAKDPEWVKLNFGVDVKPDANVGGGLLEQKFLTAVGINSGAAKKYVSVKEAWIKPDTKFPNGAVVQWCGDYINVTERWPYQHGEFPFSKLDHIPTGRFYAESSITDLIPLQKEFNRTRSQVIEAKNRMAKPQLRAPRGSIDANKVTSEPGLVIFYTPGFAPPEPLPLQNIPQYVIEEYNRIQRDMDDISSQHEITRGSVPPGVTAATAISYLQEQDDSKLSSTISSLEEAVEKVGRHFLNHVQQFWSAERKIRVIGDNGQFESFMFSRANIRGNTDFKVESGSATPTSRAAKQSFILELAKMGMIPPDRALRYLEMSAVGKLYEEMQLDVRDAQRENLRLMHGEEFGPNEWDVDPIHIQEHDNYCKTQQFQSSDEEAKVRLRNHVRAHKQKLASEQGQALAPQDPRLNAVAKGALGAAESPESSASPEGSGNAVPERGPT